MAPVYLGNRERASRGFEPHQTPGRPGRHAILRVRTENLSQIFRPHVSEIKTWSHLLVIRKPGNTW